MDELSTRVRESLSGVQLTNPVEQVVARGRSIRWRRSIVSALAALGVVATGSLAVALTAGGAGGNTTNSPVHLAAWSVDTNKDQTVTVTVRELADPERLTEVLSSAGVRTKVQFVLVPDSSHVVGCYKLAGPGVHPINSDKVFPYDPSKTDANGNVRVTIKPAAMPKGSVLSFVVFGRGQGQDLGTTMTLFDKEPGTCVLLTDEQVQDEVDTAQRPK